MSGIAPVDEHVSLVPDRPTSTNGSIPIVKKDFLRLPIFSISNADVGVKKNGIIL